MFPVKVLRRELLLMQVDQIGKRKRFLRCLMKLHTPDWLLVQEALMEMMADVKRLSDMIDEHMQEVIE